MIIKFCIPLLLILKLTSCYLKPVQELLIITDFGDYDSIEQAQACENDINWYDKDTLDDSQCTRAFAAQELEHYIGKLTANSVSINVQKPANKFPAVDSIIIADKQHADQYTGYDFERYIHLDSLKSQGFHIRRVDRNGRQYILIVGADRAGALYGAYELLEQMGVRWYGPGDNNEVIAKSLYFKLPDINKLDAPAFITRGFWAKDDRGNVDFFNWMSRNRINLWSYAQPERNALRKRAIGFLTGGHQIQQRFLSPQAIYPYHNEFTNESGTHSIDPYIPSAFYQGDTNNDGKLSYSEAHPEWFGMINGSRNFDSRIKYGTNFCTSNQQAVSELSKNFINDLIGGEWSEADMINFWPYDVGKWCQCEDCRNTGSETDRVLMLVHQVRENINSALEEGVLDRNIILTVPAYLETRKSPERKLADNFDYENNIVTYFPIERCYAHSMNDASCTDINHHHNNDMKSWLNNEDGYYKGTMFLGEYYNISLLASLPIMYTEIMKQDIPYYYNSGIRHMHYMHIETENWGTMLLTNYQFSKMLWNPSVNVNILLGDLYKDFYGDNAAEYMHNFYSHLELAMSSMKTIRWAGKSLNESYSLDKRLNDDNPVLFTSPHLQFIESTYESNDGRDIEQMIDDIKHARIYINQALKLSEHTIFSNRIKEVERRFSYGEAMLYFYKNIIETHMQHHKGNELSARKSFAEAEKYIQYLKNITGLIGVVGGTLKAGDGFTATFNIQTYNRYKRIYGLVAEN